jgi:uncharacterized small protein (DUF1192 family)
MVLRLEVERRTADLERRTAERDAVSAARDAVDAELSAWVRRAHGAEAEIERLQAELATRRVRLGIAVGRAADSLRMRR